MRKILLLSSLLISCFTVKAQLFNPGSHEGYYFDNTGTKVNGHIKAKDSYILFKKTKSGGEKQILAADIKSYVTGTDSFTVSNNAIFNKSRFLQVLINNPTKLYVYKPDEKINFVTYANDIPAGATTNFKTGNGKARSKHYFYGKSPNMLQLLTDENFISAMSNIMSDKPEIVERVKDKTINIKNIEEWVVFYLQEKAAYPPAPAN